MFYCPTELKRQLLARLKGDSLVTHLLSQPQNAPSLIISSPITDSQLGIVGHFLEQLEAIQPKTEIALAVPNEPNKPKKGKK